jgi:hypothetical protein
MRATTPRPWRGLLKAMILGVAVVYLFRLPFYFLAWRGVDPDLLFDSAMMELFNKVGWGAQLILAGFCGLSRAAPFHPTANARYRAFLETSPWNHEKPLPLGAVHLLLADWIILLVWTALAAVLLKGNPLYLPMVFLTAYLISALSPLFSTEQETSALILSFGLAAVVRLWNYPIAASALGLGLYLVAYVGLIRSLKTFPWPKKEKPLVQQFGWPLDQLGPRRKETQISFGSALVVSLMVAGWAHAGLSHVQDARDAPNDAIKMALCMGAIGMFAGLIRYVVYAGGYAAPISKRGRFWTGRWIIPGHDGAFLAAALLPLIGAATQGILTSLNWPAMHSVPVTAFALVLAATTLPPNRRQWQLSGEHRMTYATIKRAASAEQ